jgi:hypothetical protein
MTGQQPYDMAKHGYQRACAAGPGCWSGPASGPCVWREAFPRPRDRPASSPSEEGRSGERGQAGRLGQRLLRRGGRSRARAGGQLADHRSGALLDLGHQRGALPGRQSGDARQPLGELGAGRASCRLAILAVKVRAGRVGYLTNGHTRERQASRRRRTALWPGGSSAATPLSSSAPAVLPAAATPFGVLPYAEETMAVPASQPQPPGHRASPPGP